MNMVHDEGDGGRLRSGSSGGSKFGIPEIPKEDTRSLNQKMAFFDHVQLFS